MISKPIARHLARALRRWREQREQRRREETLVLQILGEEGGLSGFDIVERMRARDPEALPQGEFYVYPLLMSMTTRKKLIRTKRFSERRNMEETVYSLAGR